MKEYRIEVRIKNNWLWSRIKEAGYTTQMEFAEAAGVAPSMLGYLLSMKISPLSKRRGCGGGWRIDVDRICNTLNCFPEELFPPRAIEGIKTNLAIREVSEEELAVALEKIKTPEQIAMIHEAEDLVHNSIDNLPERTANIVRAYFGIGCKEQSVMEISRWAGADGGPITQVRTHQILNRALRKLNRPLRPVQGLSS